VKTREGIDERWFSVNQLRTKWALTSKNEGLSHIAFEDG